MARKKKSVEHKKGCKTVLKILSENYWAVSAVILAALLLAVLITNGASSTVLKPNVVGQKVLNFANAQGANATLIEVNNDGEFYEVVLSIRGQKFPVYATKDGENLIPKLISLENPAQISRG